MTAPKTFSGDPPPPELLKLACSLGRWRKSAHRGRCIPEALWEEAARLARTFGVSRISAALKLSYYDLQRRAQGEGAVSARPQASPTFIQLPASALSGGPDPRGKVEVVHPCGARLILHLSEGKVEELLPLLQAFLGQRR
jgi:hypothetical protein